MKSHVLTFSRSFGRRSASTLVSTKVTHALLLLLLISCNNKDNITTKDPLTTATTWIWSQQSEDGGWHSKTHAVLRDGKVLTPYILFHLLQLPDDLLHGRDKEVINAYAFITREMQASMNEDKTSLTDYPNYSAAYALRVMNLFQRDTLLQNILINSLLDQQFTEHRGFDTTHLVYGGWGYGEGNLKLGEHGHVDISHTRRVIETLMEAKVKDKDKAEAKENVVFFLRGVQRFPDDSRLYDGCKSRKDLPYDGGFIASAVTMSTIKSEPVEMDSAGIHYPSYATATCDGFMAMHALDMQETDAYQDAKKWLIENQNLSSIDGLEDNPGQWDEIMHYYHLAVRSEAMSIIEPNGKWKNIISTMLVKEQTSEGYFINPIGGVNKEDDPLMATIFAIIALGNTQ